MHRIPESELIINRRGAVYHLDLRPEELATTIITVGDPARVIEVSRHFDSIDHRSAHREFITHTGFIGKKRLSVVSTGIGTDNIDIVINELDALLNINLETRTIHPTLVQAQIIRVGTAGSLQADIPVDAFVASTHGLGIDNLLNFYRYDQHAEDTEILQAFITHTQLHHHITNPYIAGCAPSLLKHFVDGFHHAITVSCPGFYGPQGRLLRIGLARPDLIDRLTDFKLGNQRIGNFEMETSAIYGLGRILGHHCLSLSAIVANRVTKTFSSQADQTVQKLIEHTLAIVNSLPELAKI